MKIALIALALALVALAGCAPSVAHADIADLQEVDGGALAGWFSLSPDATCLDTDPTINRCNRWELPANEDMDLGAWTHFNRRGQAVLSSKTSDYPGQAWAAGSVGSYPQPRNAAQPLNVDICKTKHKNLECGR